MALLYLGNDSAKALEVVNDPEAMQLAGLVGKVTVEFYRKPIHFKRRVFEGNSAIAEIEKQDLKPFPKRK